MQYVRQRKGYEVMNYIEKHIHLKIEHAFAAYG